MPVSQKQYDVIAPGGIEGVRSSRGARKTDENFSTEPGLPAATRVNDQ